VLSDGGAWGQKEESMVSKRGSEESALNQRRITAMENIHQRNQVFSMNEINILFSTSRVRRIGIRWNRRCCTLSSVTPDYTT
jgi:hypothetical protein